jgi:protein-tyrosine kinase
MSRIHEALQKAELARSPVAPPAGLPTLEPTPIGESTKPTPEIRIESSAQTNSRDRDTESGLQISQVLASCKHAQWRFDQHLNVFSNPRMNPHVPEQFRTLRSRLYLLRGKQWLKSLLITSPVPGEGKTFMTANVAQAIVRQHGRSVLVIDADLRRAHLHNFFHAPSSPGLADYLNGDVDEMAIIQHGQEESLFLIPGGKPVTNPSELLSNGRLKVLLDRVGPAFDWILLDSPPCLPVADANLAAGLCDGVLLVVKAGSTSSALVEKACQELHSRNVVGVVLNAVADASPTYDYKMYLKSSYSNGSERAEDQSPLSITAS